MKKSGKFNYFLVGWFKRHGWKCFGNMLISVDNTCLVIKLLYKDAHMHTGKTYANFLFFFLSVFCIFLTVSSFRIYHICMHVCVCVCVCVCVHTYIHTYTHTFIYVHRQLAVIQYVI